MMTMQSDSNASLAIPKPPAFSLRRVWVLGGQTLLQLTRMKVFYFLVFFAIILIASSLFVLQYDSPEQELKLIKDFGLGAMTIFASLFAITATAMLIPRDIEDRTLYTVLCKPVTRMEYLLGKYVGVVGLVGLSLLFMDVLFSGVLYARQSMILAEQEGIIRQAAERYVGDDREELIEQSLAGMRQTITRQGLTWNLQWGIYAIFLKASVIAALALMISTFASTTLFTIIVGVVAFFVGHVQADVRAFYESAEATEWIARQLAVPVALVFPDFQLFNITEAAAMGEQVGGNVLWRMSVLGLAYVLVYLSLAWVFFHSKEL